MGEVLADGGSFPEPLFSPSRLLGLQARDGGGAALPKASEPTPSRSPP